MTSPESGGECRSAPRLPPAVASSEPRQASAANAASRLRVFDFMSLSPRSEVGANAERDETPDRIGGVVVVSPGTTHEAALVAIEERRVFIGEIADVQR